MKCCKSVPKMMSFLDRDSKAVRIDNRRLTSPNVLSTMDDGHVDDDDDGWTYSSLPNIVPHSEHSSKNASRHSLRTKPSDTLERSLAQVTRLPDNKQVT